MIEVANLALSATTAATLTAARIAPVIFFLAVAIGEVLTAVAVNVANVIGFDAIAAVTYATFGDDGAW